MSSVKEVKQADLKRMQQRAATLAKRGSQTPVTIEVKVAKSRLNRVQTEHLKMMFLEEKWCHNWLSGKCRHDMDFDILGFDYKKLQSITHLDKDGNEVSVEITHLSQQMKQGLVTKYKADVKSLNTKRRNGEKVGPIGFKTQGTSIFLKQYGQGKTYEVVSENRIKLGGLKKPLPVNGLDQLELIESIDENFDFSSATLDMDKVGDMFFHITVWVDALKWNAYKKQKENITQEQIGLDFGCETTVTTSDGYEIKPIVDETERLKRLQAKKANQIKHSKRWWKTILAIRKEYRKMNNRKDDLANKESSKILNRTNEVVIQDEQIALWMKGGHGNAIQQSVHGRMMNRLKASKKTVVIDRLVPTTKLCTECSRTYNIKLSERVYNCPHCGATAPRDPHSAQTMIFVRNNFDNVTVGPDGSSFNRADFDRRLEEIFSSRFQNGDSPAEPELNGG